MSFYKKSLELTSHGGRVTYHNITQQIEAIVAESEIENGFCVIQTPHTTCSVIFEEYVHDRDFNGDEYLQVDLNRLLDKIVPRELSENTNYRYPGPKHLAFLMGLDDPNYPTEPGTILNGDAHIRSSLFGASETFVVENGNLLRGSVGSIYFVDWDQNRVRNRQCHVALIGD